MRREETQTDVNQSHNFTKKVNKVHKKKKILTIQI